MEIKVYIKEKVAGIVLKQNDKIIGMIHSKYNKELDSFEIKRVATSEKGLGSDLYFLLSVALNGKYIVHDTSLIFPKALTIWKKLKTSDEWEHQKFNGATRFRVRKIIPIGMGETYLSFLDIDWFRSILFFKELIISSIESIETNLSLPDPLSVVTTKKATSKK